jgi:hypothetical protein
MSADNIDRRGFLKQAGGISAGVALASKGLAKSAAKLNASRVIGANDRINIGLIGCGGRGSSDGRSFTEFAQANNNACQILAVCDPYEKRKNKQAELYKAKGFTDYREVLAMPDIDAVVVATPDHWHAKIALDAMDQGKDVYLEKPMCHTIEEASTFRNREGNQAGGAGGLANHLGAAMARGEEYIADGAIGKMIMSQGSYHRNSKEGEWNWDIDAGAGPDGKDENYIDWKMWLGRRPSAPSTPTASSVSGSIGITRAALPRICSSTWWRR